MPRRDGDRQLAVLLVAVMATTTVVARTARPGVERWAVKTSVPAKTFHERPVHKSIAQMLSLRAPPGVQHNDRRYETARIPGSTEGLLVQLEGYTQLVALETDGDYHVQITAGPDATSGPCVIVEVPEPGFIRSAEDAGPDERLATETLAKKASSTRVALDKTLGHPPAGGGSLLPRPTKLCWQGVLFYDLAHIGDPPRGKHGMKAGNLWELHPAWLCGNQPGK